MTTSLIIFPILRRALELYQISPADLRSDSKRLLAMKIARLDQEANSVAAATLSAGELEATLILCRLFAEELERLGQPDETALATLEQRLGPEGLDRLLEEFEGEYDLAPSEGDHQVESLRALLLVFWLNHNPATASMRRLIDDRDLARKAPYRQAIDLLLRGDSSLDPSATQHVEKEAPGVTSEKQPAKTQPTESPVQRNRIKTVPLSSDLREHLEAPIHAAPRSLAGQLESAIERWTHGQTDEATLRALDLLAEERPRFPHGPGPDDAAPEHAPEGVPTVARDPGGGPPAGEGHSWHKRTLATSRRRRTEPRHESEWMGNLVLQAKHTHVWLAQLSERRGETIDRLDRIPTGELERLVKDGATGLWLIGVWERSAASRTIKRRAGALDAEASAYSIRDYRVAADLGGEDAMDELLDRAASCGLRIAVDVVPNHVGIDSTWVQEHPEWLLSVDECPFPGYDFNTPDLSSRPGVGLFLERGYNDRSDAAVVFRRLDRQTGEERFIYHGNDGTGLPWNDTAQLDYTNPEARRAMADLILEQARRFPILRFDAAMTLTRLHYQRLWFPQPGDGGAIPSRSEFGWSVERFQEHVPREFWLEITERVAEEGIDSLLIAEAFWLMESFFVRDLEMHRVYNSSFMHLMRQRATGHLRELLERATQTDTGMVLRSVFYATNPDERPAASQFGRGDRYFGVMSLLAALPATALVGHGQIEGLEEKYGMEYLRASSEEAVDREMIERHRRDIVPLLDRRQVWPVDQFQILRLLDSASGSMDDVLAVLRGSGTEATIVVFNNSERPARGYLVDGPDLSSLNGLIDDVADAIELERLTQQNTAAAESKWLSSEDSRGRLLAQQLVGEQAAAPTMLVWREERSDLASEASVEAITLQGIAVDLEPHQTMVLSSFRLADPTLSPPSELGTV